MHGGTGDERFVVAAITGRARTRFAGRNIAVVIAHPDDETVGCGALLANLDGADLVVVTDGAPRDLADAKAYGFDTADDYAAARTRELSTALDLGQCRPAAVMELGCADQQAAHRLVPLSLQLAAFLRSHATSVVLTHAYEGGHPDHDATAFVVHAAVRLAASSGRNMTIIEMPYYRLGPAGMLRQRFAPGGPPAIRLKLGRDARRRKRRMIEAHVTQRTTLAPFRIASEYFRPAPEYHFAALPNGGRVLYDRYDWGLSSAEWLRLARAALAELNQRPRQ